MAEELKKEQTTENNAAETPGTPEQTGTAERSKRPVILGCMGVGALILLLAAGAVHARDEKLSLAKKAADIPVPVEVAAPSVTAGETEETGETEEDAGVADVETEEETDTVTADAAAAASIESEPVEVEAEAEGKVTEDTEVTNTAVLGSAEPEAASELSLDAAAEAPGVEPLAEEGGEEEKGCIGDDGLVW